DVIKVFSNCTYTLFADDIALVFSDSNIDNLNDVINHNMDILHGWMLSNITNCNIDIDRHLNIVYNNQPIALVNNFKYLGLILEPDFNYRIYINKLADKLRAFNAALFRSRFVLPINAALIAYHSIRGAALHYCIELWFSSSNYITVKIQRCQKRIFKTLFTILKCNSCSYDQEKINRYNLLINQLLTVDDIYKFKLCQIGHKLFYDNLPLDIGISKYCPNKF